MLKEWLVLAPFDVVVLLKRWREGVLAVNDKERLKALKEDHRLAIFAREHKIEDVYKYLDDRRVSTYSCDCDNKRCICGEESTLTYIYNTKTDKVLTVGTTCVKTVKMASSNYKRCGTCPAPIRGFTLENMGLCAACKRDDKVTTGSKKGAHIGVVAADEGYDPTQDKDITLYDAARVLELRRHLCRSCHRHVDRGLRSYQLDGWHAGRLCATCVMKDPHVLTTGVHSGKPVYSVVVTDFLYNGSDLSETERELLDTVRSIHYHAHDIGGTVPLGFGKHAKKTRAEVYEKNKNYVDWCRTTQNPSGLMDCLLNYADLHERMQTVLHPFPE